jgi:hypothetical protein
MGFYYNKKMKVRSTSTSGSESSGSGSDSERAFSSSTRSGSELEIGSNLAKFAGARFTSPPVPDAVPMPPTQWLLTEKKTDLTTVTSDLKSMLQIKA